MIGAVVVTLTGLYWIFANTHLTKFSKETIMRWVGYQDPDEVMEIDNFGIYTGCPKKNYQLGKMAVTTIFFGLFAFPRRVLKNSGSEDFKTVLTFQN